ncbi:MAG: hypothetical protein OER85_05570 [Gammaproteobacteria bacterium]|nr:hypothetical protein [Gammaproteobacteria bacterium]
MRFKGDGICSGIPAIGKSTKPIPRAKVDTYSVREKHGLILAFLGDLPDGIHAYLEASLKNGKRWARASTLRKSADIRLGENNS